MPGTRPGMTMERLLGLPFLKQADDLAVGADVD
jgi:hypothetical protein